MSEKCWHMNLTDKRKTTLPAQGKKLDNAALNRNS